jgi:hypothetical protein
LFKVSNTRNPINPKQETEEKKEKKRRGILFWEKKDLYYSLSIKRGFWWCVRSRKEV